MNCRLVCKAWKRFLPIKDYERFLEWEIRHSYHPSKTIEYQHVNGMKHGLEITYWDFNGRVLDIENYRNNVKHGLSAHHLDMWESVFFHHDKGKMVAQYIYTPGSIKSRTFGDIPHVMEWKGETLIYESNAKSREIKITDGIVTNNGEYICRLEELVPDHSRWSVIPSYYYYYGTESFPAQRKTIETNCNGSAVIRRFRQNGRVKSTTHMLFGKRHGYRWVYDVNGELLFCGRYNLGKLEWSKQYHRKR